MRKNIGNARRFQILKRDGFRCQYCGRCAPEVTLQVDHILAVSMGGSDEIENLITSCSECNAGKSNKPLERIPVSLENQMAERIERAKKFKAYELALLEQRERESETYGNVCNLWAEMEGQTPDKEGNYMFLSKFLQSVSMFSKRLPQSELLDAVDVCFRRFPKYQTCSEWKRFKYFCGICWRKIKKDRPEQTKIQPTPCT